MTALSMLLLLPSIGWAAHARPLGETGLEAQPPEHWRVLPPSEAGSMEVVSIGYRGPSSAGTIAPLIFVDCFASGGPIFPSSAAYLKRQMTPVFKVTPRPSVTNATLGGRPATKLVKSEDIYVPPNNLHARRIPMREEKFVFDRKSGFCVLSYRAQADQFDQRRGPFDTMLRTLVIKDRPGGK